MSESKKAIKGSLFLLSGRMLERLLGIISTLVLARILVPEDFGLVAIATLFIGLINNALKGGGGVYLIQKDTLEDGDVDTAWTIGFILKMFVSVLLLLSATFVADYYNDDRLLWIIPVLTIMIPINALANPYVHVLKRNQEYSLLFKLDVIKKAFGVVTTIAVAVIYQSFWALIAGQLVSSFVKAVSTYIWIDYRPRFSLIHIAKQWAFSKWMLGKGLLGYSRGQLDTFLVSSAFGPAELGGYHISKYLANLPASEGVSPALTPLLATYSRKKENVTDLRHQVSLTLLVILLICIPITVFIYMFREPIVSVLLGDKWLEYADVFGILSLFMIPIAIGRVASQLILSRGNSKYLFNYDVVSLCLVASVLLYFSEVAIEQFSALRILLEVILALALFVVATKHFYRHQYIKLVTYFIVMFSVGVALVHLAALVYIEALPSFLAIILVAIVYGSLWLGLVYAVLKIWFKHNQVVAHLLFIIDGYLTSAHHKIKSIKSV